MPERRKRRRNREYVFFFVGDPQRIGDEEGTLGRDLDRPFGDCAEARGPLGEQVRIALRHFGDLVEQLMHREPDRTGDGVACIAPLEDLLAHELKAIHDRAAGRDYQDFAAILSSGQSLARSLAGTQALFKPGVPAMIAVKTLTYFEDVSEPQRLTEEVRATLVAAAADLPTRLDPVAIISTVLHCDAM